MSGLSYLGIKVNVVSGCVVEVTARAQVAWTIFRETETNALNPAISLQVSVAGFTLM